MVRYDTDMRRLTLILSDLYLPDESVIGALPRTSELPAFDWLLGFADKDRIGDWRRWLLTQTGNPDASVRLASLAARSALPAGASDPEWPESAWIATPVHLEVRLDHARLVDRGLLHIDADEAAGWCAEFERVFGPQYVLRPGGERAFFLSGIAPMEVSTIDPARLLGGEIGSALPGAAAAEVRRLWAEIEMWLHGCASNVRRERAGHRRVSALWLWGNDRAPVSLRGISSSAWHFQGADPFMRGFGTALAPAADFSRLDAKVEHCVLEFAPLTGHTTESLAELERHWFAPARDALAGRRLECVQIVVNDRVFTVRPRAGWKFWRRRRGWLESLA